MHFFNYYHQYSGTFYPKEQLVSGRLLIQQARLFDEHRIIVAKAIVQGIANNIYSVLYHYYSHGAKELKPLIDWLRKNVPGLLSSSDLKINQVLFIEGTIWKRFYQSFKYFLPETFLMNKRVKRPPDNPMNAMISFGNSLLYAKTITQIYHTHLDQKISFLHDPGEGRFSLSLDLCEVFKPIIVYKTIFELVNHRKIQVGRHFDKELNYCLLNRAGKTAFIKAFDSRINETFQHATLKRKVSYQTAIKLDAYKLIKLCVEGQAFKPFDFREKC